MQKGETTRKKIIDTATDLIHARGMNVVSVGDVLRASKTGKSQFYYHFESREDLINSVLSNNTERICEMLSEPIESWEDVKNWIFMHAEFQKHFEFTRGCPFGTAAYSLQANQKKERESLQAVLDKMRDRLIRFLETEKKAKRVSKDIAPKSLASFAVAAIQGALIIGLIEKNEKSVVLVLEETYAHLESFRI